jgi:EmrB/QacA subfamily drug resistance transporter
LDSSNGVSWSLPPIRTLALVVAGLMTGMLLGAMDQTIVATAGPTIISDLGGLSLYAWVFSAYILAQTVSMPIFGKLSDLYGRRRFFILGLLIFMVGSVLSGLSQTIYQLIVFRAIQGVGSGAFFPVAVAVIGVVFPPSMRGKVQGIFASVFGIAAVVGPSIGSYLVEAIDWRWIFYINLPLGVASALLIASSLKESKNTDNVVVDWPGIVTLTSWVSLLLLAFLDGGSTYPWYSWEEALLFGSAAALFITFVLVERRSKDPTIPLDLFRIRTVSSSSLVAFLRGVGFLGMVSFIPLFVQAALAGSIDDGRNVLYAFLFPMVGGSLIGGQLSTKSGYRGITVAGLLAMAFGIFLVTGANTSTSLVYLMESLGIMGIGIGMTFPTVVLAIQYSVERKRIGVASSLAQFMGNLGGTIGLAVLGSIQTNSFSAKLGDILLQIPAPFRAQASALLGNPNLVGQILATPQALSQIVQARPEVAAFVPLLRTAFAESLTPVFWVALVMSVLSLTASAFMTGSLKQQITARAAMARKDERLEQPPPLMG